MSQIPQYPPLPPNQGGALVPVPNGGYAPVPYQASPYGPVPPVPPHRGSGFWVAVTALAATGVILALLAGFFIGRGTRLSNTEAQDKITQQSQADQLAQQRTLDSQVRADQTARDNAVSAARAAGEKDGYRNGETDQSVKDQALANQQYQAGLTQGQQQGQQQQSQQDQQALSTVQAKEQSICTVNTPTPLGC
jgi:hypothetical protein